MSSAPEPIELPGVWVGLEDLPVAAANAFVCQVTGLGELVLNIGHVTPPVLAGTAEEQQAQARALAFVQVRSLFRCSMSPTRVEELIKALGEVLIAHRRAFGEGRK